jgi:hypothetical protein
MSRGASGDQGASEVYVSGARVTVNAPHVIHESIDGEVIVINLATGAYYSLKDSAAALWQVIGEPSGAHERELVEELADRYDASVQTLEAAVEPFLAELEREGLVSRADGADVNAEPAIHAATPSSSNGNAPSHAFAPPVLEKFTDMQDLVLLDPVHEVDEKGWPQRADAAPDAAGA